MMTICSQGLTVDSSIDSESIMNESDGTDPMEDRSPGRQVSHVTSLTYQIPRSTKC